VPEKWPPKPLAISLAICASISVRRKRAGASAEPSATSTSFAGEAARPGEPDRARLEPQRRFAQPAGEFERRRAPPRPRRALRVAAQDRAAGRRGRG